MGKIKALPEPQTQQPLPPVVMLTAEQWKAIEEERRENREFRDSILNNSGLGEKPIQAEEASTFLGVSLKTMRDMIRNREIKFYRPRGRFIYFYRADLNEWVRKGGKR